jgi:hypothetical protein
VAANEPDQPAADVAAAAQLSGFDVSVTAMPSTWRIR